MGGSSSGPSDADKARAAQLEAQQKSEEQKRERLRISLARQRYAGGAALGDNQQQKSSMLG
ncbi:MAG: hypothetical protein ACTSP4_00555 [Candidatus Hodarchaeales archaeon]